MSFRAGDADRPTKPMNVSDRRRVVFPPLPARADASEDSEQPRRWLSFSVAGLLLLQAGSAIVIFLMQIAMPLVVFLVMLLAFVVLHYLVWGRWLGEAIREEVEEEEREAEFRAGQRFG